MKQGWFTYSNLAGCPNGSGVPVLTGTEAEPESLKFTTASRFELLHVKDD